MKLVKHKNQKEPKREFSLDEAKLIGEKLGIEWNVFSVEQFRQGMNVELEHGLHDPDTNVTDDDALSTGKIALAHLNEFPDYYDRLEEMEQEAEGYWQKAKIFPFKLYKKKNRYGV